MQISENSFSAKKTVPGSALEKKKIMETQRNSINSGDLIGETKEIVKEATERVQRAITKEQIILTGLESIKESVKKSPDASLGRRLIEDVIDKTRFESERVLETYRLTLHASVGKRDSSVIDSIIERVQGTIRSLYSELEKNEITKQNVLSVASAVPETNPEELIKSVLESLRNENIPAFSLERERILDLLSDKSGD